MNKQQMDQAANDSILSQKIQKMVWDYISEHKYKRYGTELAEKIIALVRESK